MTTSRSAAVRVLAIIPGDSELSPPYGEPTLSETRWRYARYRARNWFTVAADNHRELAEASQTGRLIAQARLVRRGAGDDETSDRYRPAFALAPLGNPQRQTIIEPVRPAEVAAAIRAWHLGSVAVLPVGRPLEVSVGAASPARAALHYWIDESDLGKSFELLVDNKLAIARRLTATRGRLRLPRVPRGAHRLEARTDAASARLLIDQPPASSADVELARLRTVYAFDRDGLQLQVRKAPGQTVTVTMIVYDPSADALPEARVRAVVGGGRPKRIAGEPFARLTLAERTVPLPPANRAEPARLIDLGDAAPIYPRAITIPIGADIVAGSHRIAIYNLGSRRLWARFFVDQRPAPAKEQVLQWRIEEREAPDAD